MPGRARRKLSKDKGHGIDSADGAFLTLARKPPAPCARVLAAVTEPAARATARPLGNVLRIILR
jgi:hypothetical protein